MTDAQILDRIIAHEGTQYTDDPADRGRCTKYGITLATLQSWKGNATTCDDVRRLTEDEARAIYYARYIRPFDGVDAAVKPQVVDIAVNSGVMRARTLLALAERNTTQRHDGTYYPASTALAIERLKFYAGIVKHDTSQAKFLNGWINRAVEYL